jgi:hypothetical protein
MLANNIADQRVDAILCQHFSTNISMVDRLDFCPSDVVKKCPSDCIVVSQRNALAPSLVREYLGCLGYGDAMSNEAVIGPVLSVEF